MIFICVYIAAVMAALSLMIFPGKNRMVSGEDVVSDAAGNFMAVSLLLMLMMYPIFSGDNSHSYSVFMVRDYHVDLSNVVSDYLKIIRYLRIERHDDISYYLRFGVYGLVILCSVFLFFAGMYVYKYGFKIRHKILLILPVVLSVIGIAYRVNSYKKYRSEDPSYFVLSVLLRLIRLLIEYLMSTAVMIVILYIAYKVLKMILRCEILPLIIILILSFFPSEYLIDWDRVQIPNLKNLIWGANIPLFPIGMLVMKYKDMFLPKSLKRTVIWSIVWTGLGTASLITLFNLQSICIKRSGIHVHRVGCGPWEQAYVDRLNKLVIGISRATAIPWLILGLSIAMLFLNLSLRIRTGNRFTLFLRKHIFIVMILHLCNYIWYYNVFSDCVWALLVKMKIENAVITSVVWILIYFGIAVVLKRFIFDKIDAKRKA